MASGARVGVDIGGTFTDVALGFAGGLATANVLTIHAGSGAELRGKGRQSIAEGRRLVLRLPGGGGDGDPAGRDRDMVRADRDAGYITAEQAEAQHRLGAQEKA